MRLGRGKSSKFGRVNISVCRKVHDRFLSLLHQSTLDCDDFLSQLLDLYASKQEGFCSEEYGAETLGKLQDITEDDECWHRQPLKQEEKEKIKMREDEKHKRIERNDSKKSSKEKDWNILLKPSPSGSEIERYRLGGEVEEDGTVENSEIGQYVPRSYILEKLDKVQVDISFKSGEVFGERLSCNVCNYQSVDVPALKFHIKGKHLEEKHLQSELCEHGQMNPGRSVQQRLSRYKTPTDRNETSIETQEEDPGGTDQWQRSSGNIPITIDECDQSIAVEAKCQDEFERSTAVEARCQDEFERPTAVEAGCQDEFDRSTAVEAGCQDEFERPTAVEAGCQDEFDQSTAVEAGCQDEFDRPTAVEARCQDGFHRSIAVEARCQDEFERPTAVEARCQDEFDRPTAVEARCQDQFDRPTAVEARCNSQEDGQMYKCEKCGFGSIFEDNFKNHMSAHVDDACHQCNFTSRTGPELEQHIISHISDECLDTKDTQLNVKKGDGEKVDVDFASDIEGTAIDVLMKNDNISKDGLQERLMEERFKIFSCEKCSFVTQCRHHYRDHLGNHDNKAKMWSCMLCDHRTCHQGALKSHMAAIHTKEKPFQCDLCGYKAVTSRRIMLHRASKHKLTTLEKSKPTKNTETGSRPVFLTGSLKKQTYQGKIYYCDQCSYISKYPGDVKKHSRIHGDQEKYKCDVCSFESLWKENFRRHMLRHNQGKIHACDQCSYKAYTKRDVKVHSYTHTKEKACTCEVCGAYFLTQVAFRRHQLTHQGEKEYKCDQCDYKAYYKSYVDVHKKMHLDVKPYICDQCGKGFSQKGNLKKHQKHLHENAKSLICARCGFKASRIQSLIAHVKTHEPGRKPRKRPSGIVTGGENPATIFSDNFSDLDVPIAGSQQPSEMLPVQEMQQVTHCKDGLGVSPGVRRVEVTPGGEFVETLSLAQQGEPLQDTDLTQQERLEEGYALLSLQNVLANNQMY